MTLPEPIVTAQEPAQQQVERFVRRFEPGYRQLAYYAALPLVLTPELLHFLKNQFLNHTQLPWVAEADLLLSDLCRPIGYEQYAMEADVRAYLIAQMEAELGEKELREVAKLLLKYVAYLHESNPYLSRQDLQAQQLAAMVYVDADHRRTAVRELVKAYQDATTAAAAIGRESDALAELARLSRLTEELERKLQEPEYASLLRYARCVGQLLAYPDEMPSTIEGRSFQVLEGVTLEIPEVLLSTHEDEAIPGLSLLPPLQPFEFEEATVQLPGTLTFQVQQVEVVTAEVEEDAPAETEPFEFEVATLEREETGWVIHRSRQQGWRFIERLEGLKGSPGLEMVYIPSGEFLMGSPEDEPGRYEDETPQHRVRMPEFYMSRYPVTQTQWRVVARLPQVERKLTLDPSQFNGKTRPVEQVSWDDAVEFCARLSRHTGRTYRLPTEAEWEYACRAGTTTPFHFGETMTTELANYDGSSYQDEPEGERRGKTTPVYQFKGANAFGLCKMHGNVWEWCLDPWHKNYKGAPVDGSAWNVDGNGDRRIIRGGSWDSHPSYCRSATRNLISPDHRDYDIGFRVVCEISNSHFGTFVRV